MRLHRVIVSAAVVPTKPAAMGIVRRQRVHVVLSVIQLPQTPSFHDCLSMSSLMPNPFCFLRVPPVGLGALMFRTLLRCWRRCGK
jgi:hypothetical protein